MKRILLVEDDPNLGFVIKDNLSLKGYDVTLCADGVAAANIFDTSSFHLCLFDIMLPCKDGFALARHVRLKDANIPILFLTAKSMVDDKLIAFQTGADDYITKPFSLEELLCRIEVFLRRSNEDIPVVSETIMLGSFEFNYTALTLKNDTYVKMLTSKEADVLWLLYSNRHRVLKREEILRKVWGDDDYFMGRSMDVFISKLRKYLKADPSIRIVNYHAIGFKLEV